LDYWTIPQCLRLTYLHITLIWDRAISVAIRYRLSAERAEFESRQRQTLTPLHVVQTGSEVHPASYPTSSEGLFLGEKRPLREADSSPQSIAELKNT
jgi:hypothetical protein